MFVANSIVLDPFQRQPVTVMTRMGSTKENTCDA